MKLSERWSSWINRIGVTAVLVLALALGIAMSMAIFSLLLGVGVVVGGWLWWQSWRVRRQMRKQGVAGNAEFIDADYEVHIESLRLENQHSDDHTDWQRPDNNRHL
ncbi:MAG: hypothetical protein V2J55_01765 [Candidatus Competibacteraceae bacterium]|nr:hypothetical protein [Candidatus Competibacteraceae bacterium]